MPIGLVDAFDNVTVDYSIAITGSVYYLLSVLYLLPFLESPTLCRWHL